MTDPTGLVASIQWEAVGAIGAAVGGIGAAIGAAAAWRAASASLAASRDALEALAVGIRPHLNIGFRQPWEGDQRFHVRVVAVSEWPAAKLSVEIVLSSGERVHGAANRLEPGGDVMGNSGPHWVIPVAHLSKDNWMAEIKHVVVACSDSREIARYEHRVDFRLRSQQVAGIPPYEQVATERRLSAPP